jgi:hypothetical protein
MFFVTQPVCAPLQLLAAAGELQHCASARPAAVARDVTTSVSSDRLTPTAACEISVNSATRFAASVGPRFAERYATARGLRHAFDPFIGPRLPGPPTRGRYHGISKLNQG